MNTSPNSYAALTVTTRGTVVENVHFGAVAVVDARGRVIAHAGDPNLEIFTRSTIKPFQALPFMQASGPAALNYQPQHIAMLCASHSGETIHTQAVQEMLTQAHSTVNRLQCGCHAPLQYSFLGLTPPADVQWTALHHNCSGKHSGMLGMCALRGWKDDDYLDFNSPLQSAIRHQLAQLLDLQADAMPWAIDGCSAPNYALSLAKLAYGYARLAQGQHDPDYGESFGALRSAMTQYPIYVSGTGRNDEAFMRIGQGDWVSKIGADGVQVIGSTSRQQAFAIKVSDTQREALMATCISVMDQLGWLSVAQKEALAPWQHEPIYSARNVQVGQRKAVVQLERIGRLS